jgi:two-component system chemotaxis response regulator CheB
MTINVLVVDDSGFFRRRLVEIINASPNLNVIGTASDGREAIEKTGALKPDVITMDYEMPVMDGITAVREITRLYGTPVLMFSSLTYEGARVTLDALEAGAIDYLPKNFDEISRNSTEIRRTLHERITSVSRARTRTRDALRAAAVTEPVLPRASPSVVPPVRRSQRPSIVAIGASTGGPMALQQLLLQLPANFPLPIVLVQHMPSSFTRAFAERLDRLCKISVSEAKDGDLLRPGHAYLAPGGQQMMLEGRGQGSVRVIPGDDRLHYKPSLDVTFGSAANEFGAKVIAIVLTGMGADGREGARMLKDKGARIWVQDEATCVIYGMPMAVSKAGLANEELPLDELGSRLLEEIPS